MGSQYGVSTVKITSFLFLIVLSLSCTHKKYTIAQIDIESFKFDHHYPTQSPKQIAKKNPRNKSYKKKVCENQFLFLKNAAKESEDQIVEFLKRSCGQYSQSYMNQMTYTWWTTLLFSRSCIDFNFRC